MGAIVTTLPLAGYLAAAGTAVYAAGIARDHWLANAMVGAVLVSAFAAFSWHAIERPILSRRKAIARLLARA